jgi:hypothetical protein
LIGKRELWPVMSTTGHLSISNLKDMFIYPRDSSSKPLFSDMDVGRGVGAVDPGRKTVALLQPVAAPSHIIRHCFVIS